MMKRIGSLADLRVGDDAKIIEAYPDARFEYRGKVIDQGGKTVQVGSKDYFRFIHTAEVDGRIVHVFVEQPEPPAVRGAAVKYYNPSFLEYRLATHDGETGWYDAKDGGPVELDIVEWTVLFDPRKDG